MQDALAKLQGEFRGKIRFEVHDFPLSPITFFAAEGSRCAGDQGKREEMRRRLFDSQEEWGRSRQPGLLWTEYVRLMGLDVQQWVECMNSRKHRERVEEDRQLAIRMGIEGTPTTVIGKRRVVGAVSYAELEEAVRSELGQR